MQDLGAEIMQVDDLWDRWRRDGDPQARNALVCHYLPLVKTMAERVALRFHPSYLSDLYSYGVIGLIDAIEKFEPGLGRFETYSFCRIRGAMFDGVRKLAWLPRGADKRKKKIISKVVPVDFQTARRGGKPWHESLPDLHEGEVTDGLELQADYQEVLEAVRALSEPQRTVVVERYYRDRRLAEIGNDLGLTESRISQIHREALRMLNAFLLKRRIA
jgi:RNA polymerase sigma factor for flagellar operon FliA